LHLSSKIPISSIVLNISTTTLSNSLLINKLKLNLTDDFDDYPHDDEFDYSDYAYEDSKDEKPSTTTTTTPKSSSISIYDDMLVDDVTTVSYYDYGEKDVYIDDEIDETSTQQLLPLSTKATTVEIPSYHRRPPIIWNINIDNDNPQLIPQRNSSFFLDYSFLLLLILIFILT
jgi:hypothetical protein